MATGKTKKQATGKSKKQENKKWSVSVKVLIGFVAFLLFAAAGFAIYKLFIEDKDKDKETPPPQAGGGDLVPARQLCSVTYTDYQPAPSIVGVPPMTTAMMEAFRNLVSGQIYQSQDGELVTQVYLDETPNPSSTIYFSDFGENDPDKLGKLIWETYNSVKETDDHFWVLVTPPDSDQPKVDRETGPLGSAQVYEVDPTVQTNTYGYLYNDETDPAEIQENVDRGVRAVFDPKEITITGECTREPPATPAP